MSEQDSGRQDIAATLWRSAEEVARDAGVTFGHDAEAYIRAHAERGAERLAAERSGSPAAVAETIQAFRTLVRTMLEGANTIAGYKARRPTEIGEETLSFALRRLCPLFPFCD
jgi:hypothetical protein